MALKRRNRGEGDKPKEIKPKYLKVNPFLDSKEMALQLLSDLSSAKANTEVRKHFHKVLDFIEKKENPEGQKATFYQFLEKQNSLYTYIEIRDQIHDLITTLEKNKTQPQCLVAVGGGFSAGKSSFLNSLVRKKDFLPTGIDPTSVIPTYLFFKDIRNHSIKARTQQGANVELSDQVLSVLGHDFINKHQANLSNLISEISLEIPSKSLAGLTMIDTPGYSKAESKNVVGKTDKDTARKEIEKADVLIWIIDIEDGAIKKSDMDFIKGFKKKKLIIFNKADKKPESEIAKIMKQAVSDLKADTDDAVIDIIAYSSDDAEQKTSYRGNKLISILIELRSDSFVSVVEPVIKYVEHKITQTNNFYNKQISELKCQLQEEQNSLLKSMNKQNNFSEQELKKCYEEFLNRNYSTSLKNNYNYLSERFLSKFRNEIKIQKQDVSKVLMTSSSVVTIKIYRFFEPLYQRIEAVCNKVHVSPIALKSIIDEVIDKAYYEKKIGSLQISEQTIEYYRKGFDQLKYLVLSQCNNQTADEDNQIIYNLVSESLYSLESREKDRFKKEIVLKEEINSQQEESNQYCEYFNQLLFLMRGAEGEVTKIKERKPALLPCIVNIENANVKNIFESIAQNEFNQFINLLNGHDLRTINNEGYNVITYAAARGENDFINYFMEKDSTTLELFDYRGKNALHTAVENQFRDISDMILDKYPHLGAIPTSQGETLQDLAENNRNAFTNWLNTKLN